MDVFLQQFLERGSLEARYLQMILLLDQAETLANTLMNEKRIHPERVLALVQVKQEVIEAFAEANRASTLAQIEKLADNAGE